MRKRLLIAMVGLVALVLVAHDVPLGLHLTAIERDQVVTAIERDAFTIGGRISPALTLTDIEKQNAISSVLHEYSESKVGTVVIVDSDGYLLSSTDTGFVIGADYASRPEISAALLGSPSSGTRLSNTIGGELVYVAVPILSGADVLGVVRITYPKTVLDKNIQKQMQSLLLAAGVSIAMAIVVALVFARTVSQPLGQLRLATDALAAGDLSTTAIESGPRETRQLARSFNSMASRLGGLIDRQRSFAGDASHQLRTPLTALRLRLEQASELVQTQPLVAREHIDEALNETDRLTHLTEQLLRLARSEGAVLQKENIDVCQIVRDRAQEWQYLADEHDVAIVVQAPDTLFVAANQLALREIIDNYMDNALEVAPSASQVKITVLAFAELVEIVVSDAGRGMTPEQRARAFDRFWRAEVDSNRRTGSGLGLAIVAQLAQASGMRVELRASPHGGVDAVIDIPNSL
ncbi:MAG: sensor histidine kinase [Actinobacteria bacterium]|nr:MAG: sensor histidine kinase [Actinomycetota bacterium]